MKLMASVRVPVCALATFVAVAAGLQGRAEAQSTTADDIVLWTASVPAADVHGDWVRVTDPAAAGGSRLYNRDRGVPKITPALASPATYFEMSFTARRGTPYYLWVRMTAESNSYSNDSIHVQFSDSVDAYGQPALRIGSTGSTPLSLQDGPNSALPLGPGWADNGWGVPGTPIYFAADGIHRLRVQQREDGVAIDQIVLSPVTFATTAPGARWNDTTILPATPSASTVVIRPGTAAAGRVYGNWQIVNDTSAAGGRAVWNPNQDTPKITPALVSPASYFEATFEAAAGGPYHVWVRMRADGNSTSNDSVHVQFGDTVTSSGSPDARIGSTSSLGVPLQGGAGAPAPRGWGWGDNGWGVLGTHVYFAQSGTHTLRVQQREDGVRVDQIVISPDTFLTVPPGGRLDDRTILPASEPSENLPPSVTLTAPLTGSAFVAPATITLSATASDPENRLSRVEFYHGSTLLATDTAAPYTFTWSGVAAGSYQVTARAVDAAGSSATSAAASITVSAASTTLGVAFTASADHATVTRYVLEVFASTANPATDPPRATSDLGKPTPDANGEIVVDRTTFLQSLASGSYLITVAAVGSGGTARSAPITFTR